MRRPRAAIVTSYFDPHVGGVETVVRHHATGLHERGWDVEIWTSRLRGYPAESEVDGISVKRVGALNPFERPLHVPIPIPSPNLVRRLTRTRPRPDVLVAHGHVYLTTQLAAIASRRIGVPFVLVQHNPLVEYPAPIEWVERMADRTIGRLVLERASTVLCVSKHTESYVQAIAPRAHTEVISNGVDTARFNPGPTPAAGPTRFVTLRRLVARNGVDVLLDAWRRSGLDERAELVIGGTGPERERLEAMASGLKAVRFVGFVPDAELADFYRMAIAAVMPTTSGEGFGLMAAEALACGTPVIASAEGALPELVRDGVTGLLARPGDPRSLADALVRMADDSELRERLAAAARHLDLSWDQVNDRLDIALRAVLDEPSEEEEAV